VDENVYVPEEVAVTVKVNIYEVLVTEVVPETEGFAERVKEDAV
jgi:hypothetical protein